MNEEHVDIQTDDGIMPTFTCWPNGEGPFPSVVFYMDAPAIREELYDMPGGLPRTAIMSSSLICFTDMAQSAFQSVISGPGWSGR